MKVLKLSGVLAAVLMVAPALAADIAAGQKIAESACMTCHGAQGKTPAMPDAPRLAGQHQDYLLKALQDYKSGARKNAVMGSQVANLTKAELAALAAYYARQDGLTLKK